MYSLYITIYLYFITEYFKLNEEKQRWHKNCVYNKTSIFSNFKYYNYINIIILIL